MKYSICYKNEIVDMLGTSLPNVCQYVENQIMAHGTCVVRYGPVQGGVTKDMICADGWGTGACHGDSGGPLTFMGKDGVNGRGGIQLGVASFLRKIPGCGSFGSSPAVYTRVASYEKWIRDTAEGADICSA